MKKRSCIICIICMTFATALGLLCGCNAMHMAENQSEANNALWADCCYDASAEYEEALTYSELGTGDLPAMNSYPKNVITAQDIYGNAWLSFSNSNWAMNGTAGNTPILDKTQPSLPEPCESNEEMNFQIASASPCTPDTTCGESTPLRHPCQAYYLPVGMYDSAQSDGAQLLIDDASDFVYRVGVRYTATWDVSLQFDLILQAEGYLVDTADGILLCVTDARVRCDGLDGAWSSNRLQELQTYEGQLLPEIFSLYQSLLAGDALTVDEFYGVGSFARQTEKDIYCCFDSERMLFSLQEPLTFG